MQTNNQTIVLGGGCFWCTEAVFNQINGITSVVSGYAGGTTDNPTYEKVCTGNTGHAEVIQVTFDPEVIPIDDVLDIFFHTHDPTSLDRQGADVGSQYRSLVLYMNEEHRIAVEDLIYILNNSGEFQSKIVTEVKPLTTFYAAESGHNTYYEKNLSMPYCQIVISPKIAYLKEKYAKKLKTT